MTTRSKLFNNSTEIRRQNKHMSHPNKDISDNYFSYQNYAGPYFTYEEMIRKESIEKKKKWISRNGFSIGGKNKNKDKFINYVNITPSEPVLNYNFREVKKLNWLNERGFIV